MQRSRCVSFICRAISCSSWRSRRPSCRPGASCGTANSTIGAGCWSRATQEWLDALEEWPQPGDSVAARDQELLNFDALPLIHSVTGVWIAFAIVVGVGIGLGALFWRKRYLGTHHRP